MNLCRIKKRVKAERGLTFKKNFDQSSAVKPSFRTATLIGRARALTAIELLSVQCSAATKSSIWRESMFSGKSAKFSGQKGEGNV
jgi:hypothetical protein